MFSRDIITLTVTPRIGDDGLLRKIREGLLQGDTFIVKGMVAREPLIRLRDYLATIGRTSLPNYLRINEGCPNFHRLNDSDERSYVKGCFHQFVFFPWNQDIFRVFDLFRNVFHLKNRLSLIEPDKFLGRKPEDECTSRVAFQFYPRGQGFLNRHQDPVNYHQLTVPTVVM